MGSLQTRPEDVNGRSGVITRMSRIFTYGSSIIPVPDKHAWSRLQHRTNLIIPFLDLQCVDWKLVWIIGRVRYYLYLSRLFLSFSSHDQGEKDYGHNSLIRTLGGSERRILEPQTLDPVNKPKVNEEIGGLDTTTLLVYISPPFRYSYLFTYLLRRTV